MEIMSPKHAIETMSGYILRYIRVTKNKTLKDLENDEISKSTASNIEKGDIASTKLPAYLDALGVNDEEFSRLTESGVSDKIESDYKMARLVHSAYLSTPDDFLATLNEMNTSKSSRFFALINFLRGRALSTKRMEKAKETLLEAIEATSRYETQLDLNIRAMAYCEIGRIEYQRGNLGQALHFNRIGIEEINPDEKDDSGVQHILMLNQITYLENLDRNEEAILLIKNLFNDWDNIDTFDVKLQLYYWRSKILTKIKSYLEAHRYAWNGLNLARKNEGYYPHRAAMLATNLADIEVAQGNEEAAEDLYKIAVSIRGKVDQSREHVFVDTYHNLGELYLKQKRWSDAKKNFQTSLKLSKKHKDIKIYIRSMIAIAKLYLEQHQHATAENHLNDALKLAQKHNLKDLEHSIYLGLTRCYENQNEEKFQYYMRKQYEALKGGDTNVGW